MLTYKATFVLSEGLIFGLLALGILVAFHWLRFPDLTPDGSFLVGAGAYVKAVGLGLPPFLALFVSIGAGAFVGCWTAGINRLIKVPTMVAGLLVSSALYSITWMMLGKPNQFLDPTLTLVGDVTGQDAAIRFVCWCAGLCAVVVAGLAVFGETIWGLRARAIGENQLLAHDIGTTETRYTFLCLAIANGIVGLAGALFAQRSYSADVSMGIGMTITGLAGMFLGLLIAGKRRRLLTVVAAVLLGSVAYKAVIFLALEAGVPGEAFRLLSAAILVGIFFLLGTRVAELLRGLRWN